MSQLRDKREKVVRESELKEPDVHLELIDRTALTGCNYEVRITNRGRCGHLSLGEFPRLEPAVDRFEFALHVFGVSRDQLKPETSNAHQACDLHELRTV